MNLHEMLCIALKIPSPHVSITAEHQESALRYIKSMIVFVCFLFIYHVFLDLIVFPIYGTRQNIPIKLRSFHTSDANTTMMEYDGNRMSVAAYFLQRYNITLLFPHWPLAVNFICFVLTNYLFFRKLQNESEVIGSIILLNCYM